MEFSRSTPFCQEECFKNRNYQEKLNFTPRKPFLYYFIEKKSAYYLNVCKKLK